KLLSAIREDRVEAVELLLLQGHGIIDINQVIDPASNQTALPMAIDAASQKIIRNLRLLQILLAARAPLESVDSIGKTPLLTAMRHNNWPAVELLTGAGAQTDKVDLFGRDAFYWALFWARTSRELSFQTAQEALSDSGSSQLDGLHMCALEALLCMMRWHTLSPNRWESVAELLLKHARLNARIMGCQPIELMDREKSDAGCQLSHWAESQDIH
ncbi:MAG TPA: ankyrin repeat domain-containing protein, partial [Opitutales bacterium]|nr:ankyrin repeat domain-containing protein [Opitutales bacterium]